MGQIDGLWRYDGRRAVVTGCASGIGAHVVRQLTELGADFVGLDKHPPSADIAEFHALDLTDPASIDRAVVSVGRDVDALFNIAGVSSESAIRCSSSRSTSSAYGTSPRRCRRRCGPDRPS